MFAAPAFLGAEALPGTTAHAVATHTADAEPGRRVFAIAAGAELAFAFGAHGKKSKCMTWQLTSAPERSVTSMFVNLTDKPKRSQISSIHSMAFW